MDIDDEVHSAEGGDLTELVNAPIGMLEILQLGRPAQLTMARYLGVLRDAGLLPAAETASYLHVYQRCVHGTADVPRDEAHRATSGLVEALHTVLGDEELVARAKLALAPIPIDVPRTGRGAGEAAVVALRVDDITLPEASGELLEERAATPSEPRGSTPWHRRWSTLTALLCIYSLSMIAVGSLGREKIDWLVDELQYHLLGGVRPGDDDGFRNRAAADPENIRAWQEWARHAERRGRWSEAIVAHRHVVARRPDDAGALNAFAWLLCTADEAWARDPVQALELAERAYAIDQSPHITDTLAEAAYQNGDSARAVRLEEDAIRRLQGNDDFYRRQLRKFRSALAER